MSVAFSETAIEAKVTITHEFCSSENFSGEGSDMNVQATGIASVAVLRLMTCVLISSADFTGFTERAVMAEDAVRVDQRTVDRGFLRKTFVDETGVSHKYVIFVPHHRQSGVRPPVLMFLNGMGENGNDGLRQITNNFGVNLWENREHFPFIAVAPQCRTEGSWTAGSQDVQWALQILNATIREYDADTDRVYLTGVSSGGSGVWAVASAHPDRFAAIAPMCGSSGADAITLARFGMPIWNFHNERDGREVVDFSRTIRKQLLESGSSPLFTEYPVGGHDCWNRAYRTTALYRWLLEHRKSDHRNSKPFSLLSSDKILQDWVPAEPSTWTVDGDVLVGQSNSPAENVVRVSGAGLRLDRGTANTVERGESGRLVSVHSSHEFELHGDIWMDQNLECRIGLLSDGPAVIEYGLSIVHPRQGSGGLSSSRGRTMASLDTATLEHPASETRATLGAEKWMARIDPAAQQTLRADAWNDVRIGVRDDQLQLDLNGWPAMRVPLAELDTCSGPGQYRFILQTPQDGSPIRWRYVRTRHSGSGASTP